VKTEKQLAKLLYNYRMKSKQRFQLQFSMVMCLILNTPFQLVLFLILKKLWLTRIKKMQPRTQKQVI